MFGKIVRAALRQGMVLSASMLAAQGITSTANATDGYFQYGYGARQKALGGAGVADSRDATAAALNPAGLVHAPTELTVSGTLFSPLRSYSVSGAGPTPAGEFDSKGNYFPVPNLAFTYRDHGLPFVDVIGVTVYGNGGMNTEYPANLFSAFGSSGRLGVDFEQAFVSVAFAKTLAPGLSVGVAPILARQAIKLEGLQGFAPFSSDPAHVSNQGTDVSWGGGVRAGVEWALAPQLRIGVAGNSRIYTHEFEKYRGLFAERGGFDVPASVQAGIAFDATPNLTFLADYKRIWYGSVASIANPSTNILAGVPLGTDYGPGFGWKDIDVIKVGAEWRNLGNLTLRAGYSYNTSPLQSRDVLFNVLAPATVQHHITGGFEYVWSKDLSFEVAGAYVPEANISGSHLFMGQTIELEMHQWEATVGLKYRFDQAPAPLK
ncbi:MAG: OmpP1/FadL family transporter [Hyphomicrobium sp.]